MAVRVKPTVYRRKVDGYITIRRRGYIMRPARVIRCRVCGRIILKKRKGVKYPFEDIMSRIRRHYKKYHPAKFREMIERGVAKRVEAYRYYKRTGNPHIRIGGIISFE